MTENASPVPQADQEGNLIAPWEQGAGELTAFATTIAEPLPAIRAVNDTMPMTDLKEKPAKIVHVTMHAATVLTEDGEVIEVLRTVLTDSKGVNYAAVSDGVVGSIKQIAALYGPPPWDPPLELEMIEKNTRKGWRVYRLVPTR